MRTRLVERARDGDDVAFSELVDLDGDLCYAIAYRILRDVERAQDAVQQAFLLACASSRGSVIRIALRPGFTDSSRSRTDPGRVAG